MLFSLIYNNKVLKIYFLFGRSLYRCVSVFVCLFFTFQTIVEVKKQTSKDIQTLILMLTPTGTRTRVTFKTL